MGVMNRHMDDSTYFALGRLLYDCVQAQNGDSNDEEIEALWDAVRAMAEELGLDIPEYCEDDDEA